ncbi:hypothetical protein [uncultured Thiodictyon sp.]|nr:hypothetical protein [uncultured Thiodictyon sp.]
MERGLEAERRLLLLMAKMRFGAATATRSAPLLERILDREALELLGDASPDSADAAAWLAAVAQTAESGS